MKSSKAFNPPPNKLATILEVNSSSSEADKAKEGWIMSVSKTFCGVTAALMAADGSFGENKMNASLLDVLNEAQRTHPERSESIEQYRDMILRKGCEQITISQILSHRSGLIQGGGYFAPGNRSRLEIYNDSALLSFNPSKRGSVFSYCNPAFVLAEDLMGLVTDSDKGYLGELENRVIKPLGLSHTKSIYDSEESKKIAGEIVKIEGVIYDYGVASEKTERRNPLWGTQKGMAALSEGGLCSSVGDLETVYGELSKLACGMPNLLQTDPIKTREIHGFYLDAYQAGESCASDAQYELSMYCAKHYSLGIIIEAVDEKGSVVPSRGNEDRTTIRFQHIGNQPGNDAAVSAAMPFSFAEFSSSRSSELRDVSPTLKASISQKDVFAKDSLLTIVSCDYIAKMDEYFSGKCDKETDKSYNDVDEKGVNWRTYNQYWEAARTGDNVARTWQTNLITEGRLPKNFGAFHDEIREAYAPANAALIAYVKEHFCNEDGVIDSDKVKAGLKTAEDFEKVKKAIEPQMLEAQAKVEAIFLRSDQQLGLETSESLEGESWVEKVKSGREEKGYEKPTISSALKEKDGGEEKALHLARGKKSQETFVEALEKKMTEDQAKSSSR